MSITDINCPQWRKLNSYNNDINKNSNKQEIFNFVQQYKPDRFTTCGASPWVFAERFKKGSFLKSLKMVPFFKFSPNIVFRENRIKKPVWKGLTKE